MTIMHKAPLCPSYGHSWQAPALGGRLLFPLCSGRKGKGEKGKASPGRALRWGVEWRGRAGPGLEGLGPRDPETPRPPRYPGPWGSPPLPHPRLQDPGNHGRVIDRDAVTTLPGGAGVLPARRPPGNRGCSERGPPVARSPIRRRHTRGRGGDPEAGAQGCRGSACTSRAGPGGGASARRGRAGPGRRGSLSRGRSLGRG